MFVSPAFACNVRFIGTNCSNECSHNCKNGTCRLTDRWCICIADLIEDNYTTSQKVLFEIIRYSTIALGKGLFSYGLR